MFRVERWLRLNFLELASDERVLITDITPKSCPICRIYFRISFREGGGRYADLNSISVRDIRLLIKFDLERVENKSRTRTTPIGQTDSVGLSRQEYVSSFGWRVRETS